MEKQKMPIKKIQYGAVSCSIWENKFDDGNKSYSYSFSKSFKNKDGEFDNTGSFHTNDLPSLLIVLKRLCDSNIKVFTPKPKDEFTSEDISDVPF